MNKFLFLFLFCCLNACAMENPKRIVVYNTFCSDEEAAEDLEYSIKQLSDFMSKHHIMVKKGNEGCGYILEGKQIKPIKGTLTDYDLMMEITSFFNLKNSAI